MNKFAIAIVRALAATLVLAANAAAQPVLLDNAWPIIESALNTSH